MVVVSLMCGGDGLADIVGRRWGKGNALPYNTSKSWAGSTSMLLGGAAMAAGWVVASQPLHMRLCTRTPCCLELLLSAPYSQQPLRPTSSAAVVCLMHPTISTCTALPSCTVACTTTPPWALLTLPLS
jgi:CDP-diglyceride synthetase